MSSPINNYSPEKVENLTFNSLKKGKWKKAPKRVALDRYKSLKPVIDLIGEVSREYYHKGAFNTHIEFR